MPAVASKLVRSNRVLPGDHAVHDWYRFALSFPPHLVQQYRGRFDVGTSDLVLDPFGGTGTVLVECKKRSMPSLGIEANPEVGVGPAKQDAKVAAIRRDNVRAMAEDVRQLRSHASVTAQVLEGDAREAGDLLPPFSIDAVITSPPYPNEKDYTRTTRLESVLPGFIQNKSDLRALRQTLVRSNTRGVYKSDSDDALVEDNEDVRQLASSIEKRRLELGKTSGFERRCCILVRMRYSSQTSTSRTWHTRIT